jgi:triosephosphate isomerase
MLKEVGARLVIVGHSERREYHHESDAEIRAKAEAALRAGLQTIVCVGESDEQRKAGRAIEVVTAQLQGSLPDDWNEGELVVAYEPIWAIGTGETCEVTEANRVIGLIRSQLSNPNVSIQYGGSVKPNNIDEIMAQPEIDGVLVGGASLEPASFARIANYK